EQREQLQKAFFQPDVTPLLGPFKVDLNRRYKYERSEVLERFTGPPRVGQLCVVDDRLEGFYLAEIRELKDAGAEIFIKYCGYSTYNTWLKLPSDRVYCVPMGGP